MQIRFPRLDRDLAELMLVSVVMLLLALYAPIFGLLLALFTAWHGNHNGQVARRNIAIPCAALSIVNLLVVPHVLLPHLL